MEPPASMWLQGGAEQSLTPAPSPRAQAVAQLDCGARPTPKPCAAAAPPSFVFDSQAWKRSGTLRNAVGPAPEVLDVRAEPVNGTYLVSDACRASWADAGCGVERAAGGL